MATATRRKNDDEGLDWFQSVELQSGKTRGTRPRVPVPDGLVDYLTKARDDNRRPTWPVASDKEIIQRADVLYSAALEIEPPASIQIRRGMKDENGDFVASKDGDEVTHICVHVGFKRGARKADVITDQPQGDD